MEVGISQALVLMDYQLGICTSAGPLGVEAGYAVQVARRGVLAKAAIALSRFREENATIIHTRVAFDEHYSNLTNVSERFRSIRTQRLMLEGAPETEFCDGLIPVPGEIVITKGGVNPFIGTSLSQHLARIKPSVVVLGGIATTHVVESCARHAVDSGYKVVILEDLCAASDEESHRYAIERVLPGYASIAKSEEYEFSCHDSIAS